VLAGERLRATFSYAGACETVAGAEIEPLPGRDGRLRPNPAD
jgi:hypothetical protein